jgi:uncharacterized membrane protein affecting hemolysin expression
VSGLDVTPLIDAIHELRCRVDAQPKADDASRYDWQTVLIAVTELHLHVREKLTSGNPA